MNTCPEQIVHYMHAYLDGDISGDEEQQLNRASGYMFSMCKKLMDELSDANQFHSKMRHQ